MRGGFRTVVTYGGGLIALYLVIAYAGGAAQVTRAGSSGATSIITALQGR